MEGSGPVGWGLPNGEKEAAVNAIDMLKSDHGKLIGMMLEYRDAGEGGSGLKRNLALYIIGGLEVHLRLEEEFFYPALEKRLKPEDLPRVEPAHRDHAELAGFVGELKLPGPEEDPFRGRFSDFVDRVTAHFRREEQEVYPIAEKRLHDQLEDLGREMAERREKMATVY